MLVHLDAQFQIVKFLKNALENTCQIDSHRIHVCDRGWEILINIDEPNSFDLELVAKLTLSLCTDLIKYHDAHIQMLAQYDQQSGEIRIPYLDLEPEQLYAACLKDNARYKVVDTVTT